MKMRWLAVCLSVGVVGMGGCKSAFVEADVRNATATPVSLVEVDYPSASFGKESLGAGATYHYRFKIQGEGKTKILWTDEKQKEHSADGPVLKEGQQGPLTVTITGDCAVWDVAGLKP